MAHEEDTEHREAEPLEAAVQAPAAAGEPQEAPQPAVGEPQAPAAVGEPQADPGADVGAAPTPLTPTGRVILGMIAIGKQTGYDIKQLVDKSTRFFWAASYGQIYPELRRLEQQGLIGGRPEPSGARARTVYELTEAGRAALRGWLASDQPLTDELRDEGMLKLFFSDVAPELRLKNIRAMRAQNERAHAQLCAIGDHEADVPSGPGLTLQLGREMTSLLIDWCERAERLLSADAESEPPTEV